MDASIVWHGITGDNEAATRQRREAYEHWFGICTCGHDAKSHDFSCNVKSCECRAYDHISGKPDHPCNPLPLADPRRERIEQSLELKYLELKAERDYLIRFLLPYWDRDLLRGLSAAAMVRAAIEGGKPTEQPADNGDLGRCERAYAAAPPHLQARMLPILGRWCGALQQAGEADQPALGADEKDRLKEELDHREQTIEDLYAANAACLDVLRRVAGSLDENCSPELREAAERVLAGWEGPDA